MFALILDRSGVEAARYALADADLLDCDLYAERFGRDFGLTLEGEEPGASIPDGCEDYRVELTEEPGSVRVWKSANYFVSSFE
jgi:hypothetical protein